TRKVVDGADSFEWHIDHHYTGTATLAVKGFSPPAMSPDQIMHMTVDEAMKFKDQAMQRLRWTPQTIVQPDFVTIHDKIERFVHDPGEGDSFEDTRTTDTFDGEGPDEVRNLFIMDEDTGKHVYNVSIPILPSSTNPSVKKKEHVEIRRSKLGYGGAPTSE